MSDPSPLAIAQARLEASRLRLRQQFIPPPPPARQTARSGAGMATRWLQNLASGPWRYLRKMLSGNPVGEALLGGAAQWWEHHPLRATAEIAGSELAGEWRRSGVPLLRRHPVASVAIAAAAGAAVVVARPWQSRHVKTRLRPLPGRLGRWAMSQVPLQTVLTSLVLMLATRGGSAGPGDGGADHSTSEAANNAMNQSTGASVAGDSAA